MNRLVKFTGQGNSSVCRASFKVKREKKKKIKEEQKRKSKTT